MKKYAAAACLLAAGLVAQSAKVGPVANTRKSLAIGKQYYLIHCVDCHDDDGRGMNRRDFNTTTPADLTDPGEFHQGISAEAIFSSIRNGTKENMPAFQGRMTDEQIWNVVNFVRSFWPEDKRPKIEGETTARP